MSDEYLNGAEDWDIESVEDVDNETDNDEDIIPYSVFKQEINEIIESARKNGY